MIKTLMRAALFLRNLKTIMMSAALLLGMGLVAVPQAVAGGSALESWRLPWGLALGKEIPGNVQRKGDMNDDTLTLPGDVQLSVKERLLYKVIFDEKMPKAFRELGIEWSAGGGHKGAPLSTVREVILQQRGKISEDTSDKKKGKIVVTFGSSPYEFSFTFNEFDGQIRCIGLIITESLGEF